MVDVVGFMLGVQSTHNTGSATELSYRSSLERLLSGLQDVTVIHEPKRIDCGAPDFVLQQDNIPVGHVEAKDIGIGLRQMKGPNKEQLDRYRKALPNLIYTNCLDWDFYRDGKRVASASVGERVASASVGERVASASVGELDLVPHIRPIPKEYGKLENLLQEFVAQPQQTIATPQELAEQMAGKARLIKDVLYKWLDNTSDRESELVQQYEAFKKNLIHDISEEDFADVYAETITYGMFAASLHDDTPDTFSRQKALDLLPKSNPFLRSLFRFVAGDDLDDRIAWIIDDLARVFQVCDMAEIMKGFGRFNDHKDPFLHFYETFLAAYNPKKRKARGVWYTPEPVVNFIVRAVDDVLQTEFGLADGLADTSNVTVDWPTGTGGVEKREVHRVQILDPAAGTGTFLAEVIKQIAPKIEDIAPGMWSQYVEEDLIPRLHGFEILMASYAMCHMKLDMILTELGYRPRKEDPPRLSVFLTNSLEEGEPVGETKTIAFARWLSDEAQGANEIKRDMPIMCVIGNPPYLGEGGVSKGWLGDLMNDYKIKLEERNSKWLNDLYVKFVRMSSHLIEKNGEGILGFITNHGYLDSPTFRGMRWHLLKTFDKIYILDLHGNVKKGEVPPDGGRDKNVFDIQQGVAIIIAVKKCGASGELAEVHHGHLWGEREAKYSALWEGCIGNLITEQIDYAELEYALVPRDFAMQKRYESGMAITELMPANSVGIVTARDGLTIDMDKDRLWQRVQDFARLNSEKARCEYRLGRDTGDWQVALAQKDVLRDLSQSKLTRIAYRPFDSRWTYYTAKSRGFICRPRNEIMKHMLAGKNICLLMTRQLSREGYRHVFVANLPTESCVISSKTKEINYIFPLYLYEDTDNSRRVTFDLTIYKKLQILAEHPDHGTPDEVQVFDYIYGVLHCPAYRETFAEFLKIDFPRIPWPQTPDDFWDVSGKGAQLRKLHLMDTSTIGDTPYPFIGDGDGVVDGPSFGGGRVRINKTQYFDNVPAVALDFYIGGYQPARKWLKDRKGRKLSYSDIQHYRRILKILSETDRIMKTIHMSFES